MKSNPESLAGQALAYEWENNDENNLLQLIRKFTQYYQGPVYPIERLNKRDVRKQNDEFYKQVWKTEIIKLSKAESYVKYKDNINLEDYLVKIKNHKHRKALTRFRLSCHPLMIEKGRHQKPPLPRPERTCHYCPSEIEDELHFITSCPRYDNERIPLYRTAIENSIHFENLSNESKLFSCSQTRI